jgi:hypothetical protein
MPRQGHRRVCADPGDDVGPAKALCEACPVRPQRQEAGLSERHGNWGGLSAPSVADFDAPWPPALPASIRTNVELLDEQRFDNRVVGLRYHIPT